MLRLSPVQATLELVLSHPAEQVVTAVHTGWWSLWDEEWLLYRLPNSGIPCCPRGSVLMQGSKEAFLAAAEAEPERYGKHGLLALQAAFHGDVETFVTARGIWLPTSLVGWHCYGALLEGRQP